MFYFGAKFSFLSIVMLSIWTDQVSSDKVVCMDWIESFVFMHSHDLRLIGFNSICHSLSEKRCRSCLKLSAVLSEQRLAATYCIVFWHATVAPICWSRVCLKNFDILYILFVLQIIVKVLQAEQSSTFFIYGRSKSDLFFYCRLDPLSSF